MMLRSSGKPPLARSPIRLRQRRKQLPPTAGCGIRTPPGSMTKSLLPDRSCPVEQSRLRPEYRTISCELMALAKMVHQELGTKNDAKFGDDGRVFADQGSPLFERGRFYDEYSARRNEKLKRKKGEIEGGEKKLAYDLGVRVESAKKREASSNIRSRRKTAVEAAMVAAATPVAGRREARTSRYLLRSTVKENNKTPLSMAMMSVDKSTGISERKSGVRRIRKA